MIFVSRSLATAADGVRRNLIVAGDPHVHFIAASCRGDHWQIFKGSGESVILVTSMRGCSSRNYHPGTHPLVYFLYPSSSLCMGNDVNGHPFLLMRWK